MSRGLAVALVLASAAAGPACGGSGHATTPRVSASDAIVRFHVAVADAGLWVDDRFIGAVGSLRGGVAVAPGPHRFELRHEAYFVEYRELTLAAGQRLTVEVELAPLLP